MEFITDSLAIYTLVIGSIVAVYFIWKKKKERQ